MTTGRRSPRGRRPFFRVRTLRRFRRLAGATPQTAKGRDMEQQVQHRDRDRETRASRKASESGFTLVELLVVVAVIGVLMAIAVTSFQDALDRSKQRTTMSDMRTISKAIEIYKADTGHYPASGQTMAQLVLLLIPYQTSVLPSIDAWKHTYIYETDNIDNYTIGSYGKDGIDGLDVSYSTRFEFDRDIILSNGLFVASPET